MIVVVHYGCGGIRAAWQVKPLGLIDNWLRHVQDVRNKHAGLLAECRDIAHQLSRLCELNVVEQVVHVARTTIVEEAWQRGQPLALHGFVYGLADGILRDLGIEAASTAELRSHYEPAIARCAGSG